MTPTEMPFPKSVGKNNPRHTQIDESMPTRRGKTPDRWAILLFNHVETTGNAH